MALPISRHVVSLGLAQRLTAPGHADARIRARLSRPLPPRVLTRVGSSGIKVLMLD